MYILSEVNTRPSGSSHCAVFKETKLPRAVGVPQSEQTIATINRTEINNMWLEEGATLNSDGALQWAVTKLVCDLCDSWTRAAT
jgi:hypothetical protein